MKKTPLFRNGNYLITPDGEDEPVAHRRASGYGDCLENRDKLEMYGQRLVLLGAAARPDLLTQAVMAGNSKGTLNALCAEAAEAGGAGKAAERGTDLHRYAELVDAGTMAIDDVPDEHRADVAAYTSTLAELGIEVLPEHSERIVVLKRDLLGEPVAGRIDRIVRFGSRSMVLDVKSGRTLKFGQLGIAVQQAIYSRGTSLYDHDEQRHEPMPPVDQDVSLIAHIPQGTGTCSLYFVDLVGGWQAAQVASQVYRWRERDDLLDPWDDHAAVALEEVRRGRLAERIDALRSIDGAVKALAERWPPGIPTFRQSDAHSSAWLDLITAAIVAVEDRYGAPFGLPDPADPTANTTNNKAKEQ